jgi:hypothetical protein
LGSFRIFVSSGRIPFSGLAPPLFIAKGLALPCSIARATGALSSSSASCLSEATKELREAARCFLDPAGVSVMLLREKDYGIYTANQLRVVVQVVFAFFLPIGCICRRQLRSSSISLPRFSGEDSSALSSVVHPPYLQLLGLYHLECWLSHWL